METKMPGAVKNPSLQQFEAYSDSFVKSASVSREVYRVAAGASRNACDTLGRDIKHRADDSYLLTMRGDAEWLSLWASSVAGLLCSGEHPKAEAFFAQYGIKP